MYCIRVAQNAPNMKNLPGHQSYSCFLPSWREKCIETSKKLIARVGTRHLLLGLHLPYGYQGKNAIFWLVSFLTPLMAWKTQTNIGKQLCISEYPTHDPKEHQNRAHGSNLSTLKWPRTLWKWLDKSIFAFFQFFPLFGNQWTWKPLKTTWQIRTTSCDHKEHHNLSLGTDVRLENGPVPKKWF